jgi:hydrogenase nickel incorporation protein HypB
VCESCGCQVRKILPLAAGTHALEREAAHNREHFQSAGILAVRLLGSPGSGRTTWIEATGRCLGSGRVGALTATLAADRDIALLRAAGIRAHAVTVSAGARLDADLVHHAVHELRDDPPEILFLEDIGDLAKGPVHDLGQRFSVVVWAVTQGVEMPLKYPLAFARADLVLLSKLDLLPYCPGVTLASYLDSAAQVMRRPALLPVSARNGAGMDEWLDWLQARGREEWIGVRP